MRCVRGAGAGEGDGIGREEAQEARERRRVLGNRGKAFTTESTGSTEGEVDGREEGHEARAGVGVIGVGLVVWSLSVPSAALRRVRVFVPWSLGGLPWG